MLSQRMLQSSSVSYTVSWVSQVLWNISGWQLVGNPPSFSPHQCCLNVNIDALNLGITLRIVQLYHIACAYYQRTDSFWSHAEGNITETYATRRFKGVAPSTIMQPSQLNNNIYSHIKPTTKGLFFSTNCYRTPLLVYKARAVMLNPGNRWLCPCHSAAYFCFRSWL